MFAPHTDYFKAKQALLDGFEDIDFEVDEIQFIPHAFTSVSGEELELFGKFLAILDELDDVQQVYHNVELA